MNLRSFRTRYFVKRLAQMKFEKSYPGAPWLAESAILLLDTYLKSTDIGLEWGSGRSTLWLAQRVARLHSVEDNSLWYCNVSRQLEAAQLAAKVDYQFIPCEWTELDEPSHHAYVDAANAIPDDSLDFVLIDGNIRAPCMTAGMTKLRSGGLLILDNANRFIPNRYSQKHSTVHEPRSEPRSAVWAQIAENLKAWRGINTTNGIWDTRFWIKPNEVPPTRFELEISGVAIHDRLSK